MPRQPPPGKMVRRGGDGRSRLGAMATDPEVRPEGSVAHASSGGASPPEDRAHQPPRGATRPRRVRRYPSRRPYCERNSCTPFRLRTQTKRFPAAASHGQRAVSPPGGWSAAGSTPTLRCCATRSKGPGCTHACSARRSRRRRAIDPRCRRSSKTSAAAAQRARSLLHKCRRLSRTRWRRRFDDRVCDRGELEREPDLPIWPSGTASAPRQPAADAAGRARLVGSADRRRDAFRGRGQARIPLADRARVAKGRPREVQREGVRVGA
jgi:hypothetical protein